MNPLTKSAIRRLRADYNVQPDALAHLEQILNIARLADRVKGVQDDLHTEALLHPCLSVGNCTLYRLTIGADDFLRDEVDDWWPDGWWRAVAEGYVRAHARTPETLWECRSNRRLFKDRLKAWRRTLGCSVPELFNAIEGFSATVQAIDKSLERLKGPGKVVEQGEAGLGHIASILVATYGRTEEDWIWRAPIEEAAAMLEAHLDEQDRQARAGKAGPKAVAHDPDRRYQRALHDLHIYVESVAVELGWQRPEEGG